MALTVGGAPNGEEPREHAASEFDAGVPEDHDPAVKARGR